MVLQDGRKDAVQVLDAGLLQVDEVHVAHQTRVDLLVERVRVAGGHHQLLPFSTRQKREKALKQVPIARTMSTNSIFSAVWQSNMLS